MQSGPKQGRKKKDARQVIINMLAQNGPLNMWQAKKKTGLQYSSVYKAINNALIEGSIGIFDEILSPKKIQTKIYGLTFKGTLVYLAQFDKQAILDKQTSKKLLTFIKKQGDSLKYPLFQEIFWLHEQDNFTVNFFIDLATMQLNKPLKEEALQAKKLRESLGNIENNREKLDASVNHEDILGLISDFRHYENQDLKYDFAEDYLLYGLSLIKGSNSRLCELAKDIRDRNQERMDCLNQAVELFEDKFAASK